MGFITFFGVHYCSEPDYTKGIFQCIGFKEFHPYLVMSKAERETDEGQKLFKECVLAMKIATRRYARRQVKWVNARFLSKIDRMVRRGFLVSKVVY
jgi:tRNA dimethylallyltransferase